MLRELFFLSIVWTFFELFKSNTDAATELYMYYYNWLKNSFVFSDHKRLATLFPRSKGFAFSSTLSPQALLTYFSCSYINLYHILLHLMVSNRISHETSRHERSIHKSYQDEMYTYLKKAYCPYDLLNYYSDFLHFICCSSGFRSSALLLLCSRVIT